MSSGKIAMDAQCQSRRRGMWGALVGWASQADQPKVSSFIETFDDHTFDDFTHSTSTNLRN